MIAAAFIDIIGMILLVLLVFVQRESMGASWCEPGESMTFLLKALS